MRDLILLLSLITIPFFVSGQTQFIEILPSFINSKGLDYAKYEINIAKTEYDIYGIYNLSQKEFDQIVNHPDDFEILNSTETELTGKLKVEKFFSRSFYLNGKIKSFTALIIDPNIPCEVFYELRISYDGEIEDEKFDYVDNKIEYFEVNEKAYLHVIDN